MSALPCSECQRHVYTIPEAVLQLTEPDDDGKQLPLLREIPPPCDSCPKGGPENDEELRLSPRNYDAWLLYEKIHSTAGTYCIPEHLSHCELYASLMFTIRRSLEVGRAQAQINAHQKARDSSGE